MYKWMSIAYLKKLRINLNLFLVYIFLKFALKNIIL